MVAYDFCFGGGLEVGKVVVFFVLVMVVENLFAVMFIRANGERRGFTGQKIVRGERRQRLLDLRTATTKSA